VARAEARAEGPRARAVAGARSCSPQLQLQSSKPKRLQ